MYSSAPPLPPSPARGAPTSRHFERRDAQPSRPARQGHCCCHFLRGGSSVISGKDDPDGVSPQPGGGLVFSTNEDDENRYELGGVTGRNGTLEEGPEEGCGPMRMRGREEGGDEGVALDQIPVVLRPLGTAQPCILAPEKCWQVVFTLIPQKEALFPQKLSV